MIVEASINTPERFSADSVIGHSNSGIYFFAFLSAAEMFDGRHLNQFMALIKFNSSSIQPIKMVKSYYNPR